MERTRSKTTHTFPSAWQWQYYCCTTLHVRTYHTSWIRGGTKDKNKRVEPMPTVIDRLSHLCTAAAATKYHRPATCLAAMYMDHEYSTLLVFSVRLLLGYKKRKRKQAWRGPQRAKTNLCTISTSHPINNSSQRRNAPAPRRSWCGSRSGPSGARSTMSYVPGREASMYSTA